MLSPYLLGLLQEVDAHRVLIAAKNADGLRVLRNAYFQMFGTHYQQGCSPCHEKAFYKLMKVLHNPQNFTHMSERKYLLKDGYQVSLFGSAEIYTDANLTDAKAAELLQTRPSLAKSFKLIDGQPASGWQPEEKSEETSVSSSETKVEQKKGAVYTKQPKYKKASKQ